MECPLESASQLFQSGNSLAAIGDYPGAIAAFRRCLTLVPDQAAAWFNLGNALIADHQPVEAAEAFVACLRIDPDLGAAYLNLASTLRSLIRLDEALAMGQRACELLPAEPDALLCLAAVLHDRTDFAGAVKLYRQVLARHPRHPGALSSLGNSLRALGHVAESLAVHQRAVAAAPDEPEFCFNRSTALLAAGDFERGWDEYEWRLLYPATPVRDLGPSWRGEPIAGKTILLHAEQGLGDTLQFVRYAPLVAGVGARVILEVQPPLRRLLQSVRGVAQVIAQGDPLPAYDAHCPLLSLPRAFATRQDTIPANIPYLQVDPRAWEARLPARQGLRVGLVWAGSAHRNDGRAHLVDLRRSIDAAEIAALGGVAGVQFISLQKDPQGEWPDGLAMADPMAGVTDFADTAALVACLDLVIAVDTSVAHLAGAMGCPVWLLARYSGCWRWMHQRTDTPWYPGMRLFRQQRPLDWTGVIRRVRAALVTLASTRVRPHEIEAA